MQDLSEARTHMAANRIDAWLVYDFRGSNPVMWQLLGETRTTTRRSFLLIRPTGPPVLICHAIETHLFAVEGIEQFDYVGREQMRAELQRLLDGAARIAVEYSPGGALPILSWVDAGTLELIRACSRGPDGEAELVSSADLVQVTLARWTAAGLASHRDACRQVDEVKNAAFALVAERIAHGTVSEYDVQQFIVGEFAQRGLETDHAPIVAVNANSGNPHYEPRAGEAVPVGRDDWLLIDLWARHPGERNIFADITWVATSAPEPSRLQVQVFDAVRIARDEVVRRLQEAWRAGEELEGWQLDRVAADRLAAAGLGDHVLHRTGHSLGPGPRVHALGVNLDDLETRDTRRILPGLGFSVEPGLYLPDFGVRLEIDVYVDPEAGPVVTTSVQEEVVSLF